MASSKKKSEQLPFKKYTFINNKIFIDGTSLLIFRDMSNILKQYCFPESCIKPYKYLDFGCGAGLSTDIYSKMISSLYSNPVEIHGMDISKSNLPLARLRIPHGTFEKLPLKKPSMYSNYFDLITCNLVLLEQPYQSMIDTLEFLHSMLKTSGIFITVNCSIESYNPKYQWYSFHNDFSLNQATQSEEGIFSIREDAKVKIKKHFPDANNRKIYVDYFHSESSYITAFQQAGFNILKTYKPLGNKSDGLPWKSETDVSPYLIHILQKI